eukprot:204840_1
MASYQNAFMATQNGKEYGTTDNSVTNLDQFEPAKHNVLSYFNFISSKRSRYMKYYVLAAIISVVLILVLLDETSSGSSPSILPTMDDAASGSSICEDPKYFKKVLKEEHTQSIGGMFKILPSSANRFEASGVAYDAGRDVYWVVFDSLHAIGKLSSDLTRNDDNILVHPSSLIGTDDFDEFVDSDFEGIVYDIKTDILYLLSESVLFKNGKQKVYHPILRKAIYDDKSTYDVTSACVMDYDMPSDNKGFEGLGLVEIDGTEYLVGQCEGNHCASGSKGRDSGNGQWVLFDVAPVSVFEDEDYQYLLDVGIECVYKPLGQFELPSYVDFEDYSDFAFKAKPGINRYDVVIISQASSMLWVGEVEWDLEDGPDFDVNKDDGTLLEFPKRYDCETVFCNVEGS